METEALLPSRTIVPSFTPPGSGAAVFTPSSAYLHLIFRQVHGTHCTVTHVGIKQAEALGRWRWDVTSARETGRASWCCATRHQRHDGRTPYADRPDS